ncbi:substrate-binding domain-containing protein [Arthrobacter sp. BE255]|uniref:substrate-binding domain-containing protein n=1 Tax=Arthrobacter sp. BE255 TaxID=2817721 RepID=UPI002864F2A3|nr:substrate-binding domain-containing protein [Arthrobacter sp. BE255]MDR7161966.1 ABC-type sugar transport system substrate-binding protein [Arthrobacter sp. BE255]
MRMASRARSGPNRNRSVLQPLAALLLAASLAGCSTTTGPSGGSGTTGAASGDDITAESVDQQALAATIKKTFLTDIPVSDLDPVVADAMAAASRSFTPEQNELFKTCLQQGSCDTGRGSLTMALAMQNANPWVSVFRGEATAQALAYPQVKRIVYNNANGDVAAVLANLRSLIAQRVDIIVTDPVFGGAIASALQQAKQAGITVVTVNSELPEDAASSVSAQVPLSLCDLYTEGAQALVRKLGNGKSYALYTGIPGNSSASAWQPCAKKVLDGAGWTQVTEGFTQWTPQGAAQAANALLASGQEPAAIIYDYTTDDFAKPYIAEGRTPPVFLSDVMNYSWLSLVQQAKQSGTNVTSWLASSHVWFGRFGVTAGIKIKQGQQIPAEVPVRVPTVATDSVLDTNRADIPSSVPVSSLLTPEQMNLALAAP